MSLFARQPCRPAPSWCQKYHATPRSVCLCVVPWCVLCQKTRLLSYAQAGSVRLVDGWPPARCRPLSLAVQGRFLLTSTSEVYGDPLQHPQREEYWGNVNPIGERSCYDEGRRAPAPGISAGLLASCLPLLSSISSGPGWSAQGAYPHHAPLCQPRAGLAQCAGCLNHMSEQVSVMRTQPIPPAPILAVQRTQLIPLAPILFTCPQYRPCTLARVYSRTPMHRHARAPARPCHSAHREAHRRDAHHGLPQGARHGGAHCAHLQHLRPPHGPG